MGPRSTASIRAELQKTMQSHAAVYREQSHLAAGCERVSEVCKSVEDVGITDRSMIWNTDLVETLELQNLLVQGAQTMFSAERARRAAARTRATISSRATTRT